eukprot:1700377-Pleurochrysis_carterae.AAC.1
MLSCTLSSSQRQTPQVLMVRLSRSGHLNRTCFRKGRTSTSRREPSDYEQVSEKELDSYIAVQGPATPTATTPAASPKSPSEILLRINDMQTASLKAGWTLTVPCHRRMSHAELAALCNDMSWSSAQNAPKVVCAAVSVSNRTNLGA